MTAPIRQCRCIEEGAECGHLPECPFYRSAYDAGAEDEPADHGPECRCDDCCDRKAGSYDQARDAQEDR